MQAALFRRAHEPVTTEPIDVDRPQGREVLARTVATGVCHSDPHYVDGAIAYAAPAAGHQRRPPGHVCEGTGRWSILPSIEID